ncbi:MAG TPA: PSD1 and planctomycete cytochrome C domain-containing protein, partial [Fimbriimonadaceae bacterium]|nr:PSD1 and planctomycete cytochrome C domain-containing protein [Fimbriimonadaceae bacterium]
MKRPKVAVLVLGLVPLAAASFVPDDGAQSTVTYGQVSGTFHAYCTSCHSGANPSGGLDLSSAAGIKKGGFDGAVIVPGKPEASLLVKRIKGLEGMPQMPMGFNPLDAATIKSIEDWIRSGAKFDAGAATKHWAYVAPERPPVPKTSDDAWVRNPIDAFVLARLDKEGLKPSPQADKATLVRRLYLDLVGLPPTIDQMEAYLADTKPGAYERLVDKLLSSPHFGERQAIGWLDLARYADTNGYEADRRRTMWPYRDWVIKAFNDDMPFDEFTIDQIAGDMLPNATRDQLIATGFNRNTMYNEEGGVDRGEQRWLTMVDRVGTTATVWLGTTLACAQCHDHKYDPFTNEEFYKFLAFFDNCEEPTMSVLDPVTQRQVKALNARVSQLEKALIGIKQDTPAYKAVQAALAEVRAEASALSGETTLIFKESETYPPKTPMRIKGTYTNPGKTVTADTPSVLPPIPAGEKKNRLGLARWLVSRDNPLTARVVVNRMWQQYFGTGLVKTSGDFGTMGERPSHPDLLDWLAVEFMDSGWDMKHMHKLIVMSSTYRQASTATKELIARDPDNRLLARGARERLPAELIRDNALVAAGLLSDKMGGPSVFPDQPDGVWKLPYNDDHWVDSTGDDLYRRGIYTFWRRSAPYPSFINFDAISREGCTVKREETDTPLQALTLMNDEAFQRAARGLAQRMMEASGEIGQRIENGFRR